MKPITWKIYKLNSVEVRNIIRETTTKHYDCNVEVKFRIGFRIMLRNLWDFFMFKNIGI